tara:strand:- start:3213 stop:4028 length:816 start_codon:yes stop_codon:yes gene_type:complete
MAERKSELSKVIEIEEVNILSIDKAVYDWFDKKHPTIIKGRKVPVLFGGWERFAQMQGNKEDETLNNLRDHNGMLKLPIISIRRGDIEPNNNRFRKLTVDGEPSITIKKKIAPSNFNKERSVPFQKIDDKGLKVGNESPVYEVHRVPFPDFINVPYTITFWSSYVKDSNYFSDKIWGEYFLDDMEYNGYYFYAYFNTSSNDNNTQDFSGEERIIRTTYELQLEAYLIAKNEIKIDRTPSKIILEERFVGIDEELDTGQSIDEIISTLQSRR